LLNLNEIIEIQFDFKQLEKALKNDFEKGKFQVLFVLKKRLKI